MKIKFASGVILGAISLITNSQAQIIDGQGQNQTDQYGYYYMVTGGKLPASGTPNGSSASGGVFQFLTDDPVWGRPEPHAQWAHDGWHPENAGFALTLKNNGAVLYDNNGIEDGTYGDYYNATGSIGTHGLHVGYSMSNNFDWVYSSYFKIEAAIEVDEIIGYFDAAAGLDPDDPNLAYRMNIFSGILEAGSTTWAPAVDSFTGDILSSDSTSGSFTWSDSGVDRVYDALGTVTDDIFRLTFSLDAPITLDPGVYFFSHDAVIAPVPEPHTIGAIGCGLLLAVGTLRRRFRN